MKPSEYLWMIQSSDPASSEFAMMQMRKRWNSKEAFLAALLAEKQEAEQKQESPHDS